MTAGPGGRPSQPHRRDNFSSPGDSTERPFGSGIIDLQQPIVEVTCKRLPVRQCIADRAGGFTFGRERAQRPSRSRVRSKPQPAPVTLLSLLPRLLD
jgi:hypothetical protein